jgi:methylthioxylose transferase
VRIKLRTLRSNLRFAAVPIAAVLLGWAVIWGRRVQKSPDVKLGAAPLVGQWKFRPSIGYLMPIVVASFVIIATPRLFVRLQTRWLVLSTVGLTAAFTAALAGADGRIAMLAPVVHRTEYLFWLDKMPPVRKLLTVYDEYDFIVNFGTHIKGHPPGYILVLKALAAIGLTKPWIIASVSYLSAGLVAGSVLVVARRFGSATFTRRAAPFLILAPYAVWMGTSADAMFSAFVAMGAAGIAMAATSNARIRRLGFGLLAGLLIGLGLYSSWGTVTCGPIIAAALWCGSAWPDSARAGQLHSAGSLVVSSPSASSARRSSPPSETTMTSASGHGLTAPAELRGTISLEDRFRNIFGVTMAALGGIVIVAIAMTLLGYNWFAGIGLTKRLYWKGTAQFRPWRYFLIGNLGAVLLAIGAVAVIGIAKLGFNVGFSQSLLRQSVSRGIAHALSRRATSDSHTVRPQESPANTMANSPSGISRTGDGLRWLRIMVLATIGCVLIADLSQYSKGEVERIWLPFMPWLTLPSAILHRHRLWLILQASTAIGLQIVLISKW